jgi:glycosyltransferase involved in cell wall biosynthesis
VCLDIQIANVKMTATYEAKIPMMSVIVPVYNTAPWLPRCLESLAGQTYRNLEIICVDDGSTDGSAAILDEYAARDARIKVIHQENAGVSAARNRGLEAATGEYVTFVDGDDWIEEDAYEMMMRQFTNDVDIVAMGAVIDGETEAKKGLEAYFNRLPMGYIAVNPSVFAYLNISLPTKVYRRSLIEQYSIRFPVGITYGEDSAFVCCVLAHSRFLYNVGTRYYHYVQHEGSAMHNPALLQRHGDDLLKSWDYMYAHYIRWGLLDKFWPLCERRFTDFCAFLETTGPEPELKKRAWQLAKLCGLDRRSHHPSVIMMRMYYMPGWETLFHWFRGNCECFGIAGRSVYSVTYTGNESIHRFLGRVVYRKPNKCVKIS